MATVASLVASQESHATLNNLFTYAGAPGDPPEGGKEAKALAWLRRTNKDPEVDPMRILGRIIENYMEAPPPNPGVSFGTPPRESPKEILTKALGRCELNYSKGGVVLGALGAPSKTLEQLIRDRDLGSINAEFDRALRNVETNPPEAVSAACNILESVCKTYIHDENLEMPAKQDIQSVWGVVRKHLGFDPGQVADRDLQEILSGLIAIVNGVGALRTHASSAHGAGRRPYKLEPRHARLAIHAAHTVALFILEAWDRRRASS